MTHRLSRAAVLTAALSAGARAQATQQPAAAAADRTADLVAAAKRARGAGRQGEFLACGQQLRAVAPADPTGHFIIASAYASLGPAFSKDVARHAFDRVLALARDDLSPAIAQRLLEVADLGSRAKVAALRDAVRTWQGELAGGKRLLLAPDKAALAHASDRAQRLLERMAGWAADERSKIERVRQQRKAAEKDLTRERKRARDPAAGFIDVQPFVDRIASCGRTIAASERWLRELDKDLRALRAELEQLAARLAELE